MQHVSALASIRQAQADEVIVNQRPIPRVNWWQIMIDLERKGVTVMTISKRIDVAKSTLLGWKNQDAEPRYGDGEMLIALWVEVTGMERGHLPRVRLPGQAMATEEDHVKRTARFARTNIPLTVEPVLTEAGWVIPEQVVKLS